MSKPITSRRMSAATERRSVAWREVSLFIVFAYALTWGWNAIWIVPRLGELLVAPTTPPDPTVIYGNLVNFLPGMFGPLIAAIIMRLWVSREGLAGSLGLRRSWRAYAVALLAPIGFLAVVAAFLLGSGLAGVKLPDEPMTWIVLPLFAIMLLLECILGFGEEYGWRGYLLPRLMPLGEVPATLLIGIVWQLWHLPVLLTGVLLGGHALWLVVAIHISLVVISAFPYTWLGRATSFSPAVAAVFHGAQNWSQQRLLTFLVLGNLLVGVAVIGAAWLMVVLAYYGLRWAAGRRHAANMAPAISSAP